MAVFGYRLGRPALPDPSDAFEDQMAAFCPLGVMRSFWFPMAHPEAQAIQNLAPGLCGGGAAGEKTDLKKGRLRQ
jgi:hypothetical protein